MTFLHRARTTRAYDREKLGIFATIGTILAYTDHTTPPPCACLARHHFAVWGRWGICHACCSEHGMLHILTIPLIPLQARKSCPAGHTSKIAYSSRRSSRRGSDISVGGILLLSCCVCTPPPLAQAFMVRSLAERNCVQIVEEKRGCVMPLLFVLM